MPVSTILHHWLPTDIVSAGSRSLKLWYKSDQGVVITSGGVSKLQDHSGGNHSATASTARPTIVVQQLSGRSIIRFNGAQFLLHTFGLTTVPHTVFVVFKRTGGSSWGETIQFLAPSTAGDPNPVAARTGGSANWGTYYNGEINSSYDASSGFLVACNRSRSGNDLDLITNGNVETKVGAGWYGGDGNDRRSIGGNSGEPFVGDIAEILVFDQALSDSDRVKVETYLNTKYLIY